MPVIVEMPEESCRTVCNGKQRRPSIPIRGVMPPGYFDVTATGRRGAASRQAISARSGSITAMEMPRLRVSGDEICSRGLFPNVCHSALRVRRFSACQMKIATSVRLSSLCDALLAIRAKQCCSTCP